MKASDLHKLAAPFPKEDIHWRAQTVTKDGKKALALAYLDARNVMERLDAVCGVEGWQSEHYDCGNGRMGCKIGIFIEGGPSGLVGGAQPVGEWVWKSDGAGGTDVEADKGAFSDALKRAAVSWGIGRYLYALGQTWVPCKSYESNGKHRFSEFIGDPWKYVKGGDKVTWRGPLGKMDLKNQMTTLADRMRSASLTTTGDLEAITDEFTSVIEQAQSDAPDWWRGYADKRRELLATLMVGPASANPDNPSSYTE